MRSLKFRMSAGSLCRKNTHSLTRLKPCAWRSLSHLSGAKIINCFFPINPLLDIVSVQFTWISPLSFHIWIKILRLSQLRTTRPGASVSRGTESRGVQLEQTKRLLTSHWEKYKSSLINPNNKPNRILIDAFQTDLLTKQTATLNIYLTKSHFFMGAKTVAWSQSCRYTPISIA